MEYLKIINCGPIKEIELSEIRKFNLFIGESGSGKSTIMKVLAMMRWIYKMICIRTYLSNAGIEKSPFRLGLEGIMRKNGLNVFINKDSHIIYRKGSFEIQIKDRKIRFPKKNVPKEELTIQKISYISDKRVLIPDLASGNVSLRHNMFYLDETFLNFQKAVDRLNGSEMEYLGVRMTVKKSPNSSKRVYVSSTDETSNFDNLPLTSASSGIQSSVALHFIIQFFSQSFNIVEALNSTIVKYLADTDNLSKFKPHSNIGNFPNKKISVHLEEPELSLFPSNQWGLMRFLIQSCLDSKNAEMDLTMASHSPYILTALNVMTLAFRANLINRVKFKEIKEDMPLLDPRHLSAWEVKEGKVKNLIDPDLHLIDGTYLDSTSDIYENLISDLNDIVYE